MDDAALPAGALVADRYRIDAPLGEGGMARVYRATDLRLERPVAVKVMRLVAAAHAARFEREAKAAGQLAHPAVVGVYDHGVMADGCHFLVLEFIHGSDLSTAGQVDPATAIAWLRPIVGALVEAHAAGIIHRDIKPENLVLTEAPGVDPSPRLLDFGIAAVDPLSSEDRLTKTGAVFGTPAFMSPEQALGRPVTPAADLWAIGATLYALIAGRPPFRGDTPPETLVAVIKDRPPPLPATVPRWVQGVISACLQKEPAERPADAAALLELMTQPARATSHLDQSDTVFQSEPPVAPRAVPSVPRAIALAVGGLVAGILLTVALTDRDNAPAPSVTTTAVPVKTVPVAPAAPTLPKTDPLESARTLLAANKATAALAWLETHPDVGDPNQRLLLRGRARVRGKKVKEGIADLTAALTADGTLAGPELVDPLIATLKRRNPDDAVGLLAGPLAKYAEAPLSELPSTARYRTRWHAVEALERIDADNQVPRFQALLRDLAGGECDLRKKAARALGELGNPEAIGPLRRSLGRSWFENMCMDGALKRAIRKLKAAE